MALCRECGRDFEPWSFWDIYCSPECAKAEWLRETKARALQYLKAAKKDEDSEHGSTGGLAGKAYITIPRKLHHDPKKNSPTPHGNSPTPPRHFGCSPHPATCAICGKEFVGRSFNAKYCSKDCRREADNAKHRKAAAKGCVRRTVTCLCCGETFETLNQVYKTCDKCRAAAEKRGGRRYYLRTCVQCGAEFRSLDPQGECCSYACATALKRQRCAGQTHICRHCGAEFEPDYPGKEYCSAKCREAAKVQRQRVASKNALNAAKEAEAPKAPEVPELPVCTECGKEFTPAVDGATVCAECFAKGKSTKTYKKSRVRKCAICGKEFCTPQRSAKVCSEKCREVSRRQAGRDRYRKKHGCTEKTLTCVTCGAKFTTGHGDRKRCDKCLAAQKAALLQGESVKNPQSHHKSEGLVERKCSWCGKVFTPVERGSARFCSTECADEAREFTQTIHGSATVQILPPPNRKCHDCGAPTSDYRCDKCKARWRAKNGVPMDGQGYEEAYAICR